MVIHHHIARAPACPAEVSPDIPGALGAIILKLLRKSAGDRYQTATGVRADLETCLQRLQPDNSIDEFPLAGADCSNRLRSALAFQETPAENFCTIYHGHPLAFTCASGGSSL